MRIPTVIFTRLALSVVAASVLTFAKSAPTTAQQSAALQPEKPCAGCLKHDGKDTSLMPKDSSSSDSAADTFGTGGGGSPTLHAGTENTTLQGGTENTRLQVGTQNTTIQAGIERQAETLNLLILIDCSQSMKEGLGGPLSGEHEEKMNAAKMVLEQTMSQIPSDVNVGLRVFGQSFHNDPYVDCQQTALLVPIGNHNRRTIIEKVRQIRPYGLTPLTYALREAANDLAAMPGRKQLILISDGAETCGYDPCMEVRRITASGINMKIDIVGLGLRRDWEAKAQLNSIASQTGGKFYDANTAAEMIEGIRNTVKQAIGEGQVSGKVLTKFKTGGTKPPADQLPADLR